ncbi:hypothetical protein [Cupriavidus oxalaticus]|jgi:hypothetical protein|uniref:Uncharacterized protein n=1 Tax=Cupriavidus oxalaticus TaxID=96344 RepID=A0A375FYU2_9BURK|nr:hypothetical protein [Cupriavidus oxalaticus]QRQ85825.1 hypothetical protein JTE91_21400 [Cupriavidus oxalaticus]QRQ95849.1 hypothetical protein JTE92_20860 [Cupriavidus oxalaticus]WQD84526.1 hypothetical protein U0036_08595 [Cupriavidus oxalaticus]SPC06546.1 conserved hypothetical protein [Cupriavidus oxalaticus]SPC12470.1 conserved hypothetical protein [Cupriavidus oxalaticus]
MPEPDAVAMARYTDRVFRGLFGAVASLLPEAAVHARQVAEILLHHPPVDAEASHPRSDLNVNGSPLQLLLSARPARWEARLIADPAFHEADPLVRWRKSLAALEATLRATGAEGLRELVQLTVKTVIPQDEPALRQYPTGMIRLAAGLASRGAAVYMGAPHRVDRWDVARRWAACVLGSADTAHALIGRLEPNAAVFGMGVEGVSLPHARAKLYWRLRQSVPIDAFGMPWLASPAMTRFLAAVLGDRSIPLNALTFSAGFDVVDGTLTDVKTDVCIANAGLGLRDALQCVNEQAALLGLSPRPLDRCSEVLEQHRVDIGCLGLGSDSRGTHRLNIYLHQRYPAPSIPRSDRW